MTEATSALPLSGWRRSLRPALLDRAEQVAIALLWVFLVRRVFHSDNPYAPLVLVAETTVLFFVLIRRPTEAISVRLGDWLLAVTATAAPLLMTPGQSPLPALAPLGMGLFVFGNGFQIWAKLYLRRSFGIAPANRGIKVDGPYRFVRHPMYAGYLVVHVGIFLLMASPLNMVLYVIGWWAQILRLLAEERLLGEDPAYRGYMAKVRWRLIPGLF